MSDFEMPYFVDGGGNKGYFKDTTARNQIVDTNTQIAAINTALGNKVDKSVLGLLQYHTISNIDSPWDSGVAALTITFYRVSNVSEHSGTMPFGNSSFVICTSHSSKNYGMQIAFSDNPECFAARALSSGTWGAWKKIGDSGTTLGSSVSLNSYSSSTNKYTVPNDGYVMVYAGSGTGFSVCFDSVNSGTEVIKISSNAPYTRQSIFVKKGMKVYGYPISGSSYQFYYYPLQ